MKILAPTELLNYGFLKCNKCNGKILHYTANHYLIEKVPEAEKYDYWMHCSNENCDNHYGVGYYSCEHIRGKWEEYINSKNMTDTTETAEAKDLYWTVDKDGKLCLNRLMNNINEEQFTSYIPEKWIMLKDNIYAAQRAIRIGLEHINEHIKTYESFSLSRQNRKYLEILKNEKLICEQALEGLNKPE